MKKDIIGWVGVLLVLCAFILITLGTISSKDMLYGILNAVGALGIIISSYKKKDFQPVALNVVWLLVAMIGIIRSVVSF